AQRVGILKAGLYYYVSAKEDLLYELALGIAEDFLEQNRARQELLNRADAVTRLKDFIVRWVNVTGSRNNGFIAVEREYRQLQVARLAKVIERRQQIRAIVHAIIVAGIAEGAFDPGANVSVAVTNI